MGILDGRVAIVTGASSGIGHACARRFAEEGAMVVACARRLDLLEELAGDIKASGGQAIAVQCDVESEAQITGVVEAAANLSGRIDILCNFAQGYIPFRKEDPRGLIDTTPDYVMKQFITGTLQSMLFMQKCFPYMKQQHYGRIINTASPAWIDGAPDHAAYGISKAATSALTRHASQDWGKYGIVTNTIFPLVQSPDYEREHPGFGEFLANEIPVKRYGTAYQDLSPVVTFLVSEDAGYVNGQSISISGGLCLLYP